MDELIFVTQKIILRLIYPVCFSLILGFVGLLLWRKRALSFLALSLALIVMLAASIPVTGLILLRTLESKAGSYADPDDLAAENVRFIVVLSGGFRRGELTAADHLGETVLRVIEAVRLWRRMPDSKLVLTGGVIPGLNSEKSLAEALADAARNMGVPGEVMVLEDKSWTTEDQAKMCAPIVGERPFALVTSAYHMPRAILLFRRAGLSPIPAPADFRAKKITLSYGTLMPQSAGLWMTQEAIKQYTTTWWILARDRVASMLQR
jgi:uncharacterized SAM-binding protein YcdF (DUF218 family)